MPRKKMDPKMKKANNSNVVRVSDETHRRIAELDRKTGIGMGLLMDKIVQQFLSLPPKEQRDAIIPDFESDPVCSLPVPVVHAVHARRHAQPKLVVSTRVVWLPSRRS